MIALREKLLEFCDQTSCSQCILDGEVCRCGRGAHFFSRGIYGDFEMSDSEIKDAFDIIMGYSTNIITSKDVLMNFLEE